MRAVQHRHLLQLRALLVQLQDALRDKLRLLLRIRQRHERRPHPASGARGHEMFFKLMLIRRDHRIREFQHLGHRAVVRLDFVNFRARMPLRKFEDVPEIRAAPRVDALRVVAHDHDIVMPRSEHLDEVILQMVRVLIFVHEDELKLPLVVLRDGRIVFQKHHRLLQQVVEIQRVRLLLPRLIFLPHVGDVLREFEEVRIFFEQHIVELASRVELEAEHIREHSALWKTLLLRIESERRDHAVEHFLGVLAVHDAEARREARLVRMPPQDARAHAVKSAAPQPHQIARDQRTHALAHLARRLVCEREQQDVLGPYAVLHEIRHAVRERARFAAARARDHECRARRRGHGLELLRVQLRGEINPRAARLRSVECVVARHR